MRGRLTVFVLVLVAGLLAGPVYPASANVITRKDGNDAKGPLDMAGVKVSHASNASVFRVTTIGAFSNADVALKKGTVRGLFEVALDTNEDKRPNFYVDVFYASGRFRGVLSKPSGDVITYSLKAARVSGRAVKVVVPHAKLANKGSYDFAAFSVYFGSPCSRKTPCLDAIPNRYPLIKHDFTAPKTTWGSVPKYTSDISDTFTFSVAFGVQDDVYGSGVKSWSLQRRAAGTSSWVVLAIGSAAHPTPSVLGNEGSTWDLRVVAVDKQGNKSKSGLKRVTVPFDDRSPTFIYSASTQTDSVPGAFLGTTSSVDTAQTVSFQLPYGLEDLCVLGGPTGGNSVSVNVRSDGVTLFSFVEDGTTPAEQKFCYGDTIISDYPITIDIGGGTGPFVFDGLLAKQ